MVGTVGSGKSALISKLVTALADVAEPHEPEAEGVSTFEDQPPPGRRRVRPYTMTGGRTRPAHTDLEIEVLVSTTSAGERTHTLTVEQGPSPPCAATSCRSPRSRPASTCPSGSPASWSATWPTRAWWPFTA